MESYSVPGLHITPSILFVLALVAGLVAGSFLNVVIVRLPRMLERAWQQACAEGQEGDASERESVHFNLAVPGSHCPQCQHPLSWYELIPVASWLWQKGRCRHCGARIAALYPLVECLTAVLFAAAFWRFGATALALAAMLLMAALIALAVIDLRTMLLPDVITQPLLWSGLLVNWSGHGLTPLHDAVAGAVAGYGVLWLVATSYQLLRGKEGMGQGDFKLLAALGAWLGWQALPGIILVASLLGVVVGLLLIVTRRLHHEAPLPFGPCLALGGVAALLLPPAWGW